MTLTAAELDGGSAPDAMAEDVAAAAVVPEALTIEQAQTLLDAINTAHRNSLDVSGMRAWLASYGHATALSASGAFVLTAPRQDPEPPTTPAPAPAPSPWPPHGPQPYPLTDAAELAAELSAVDGLDLGAARALAAAHLGHITRVNWSDRVYCRTCGSDRHFTSACPITTPPARGYAAW